MKRTGVAVAQPVRGVAHWCMRPLALGILATAIALGLATSAEGSPADAGVPACIAVSTAARWVPYGYDHVVVLASSCGQPATCSVATDVNPTPTVVEVRPRETIEVITFRASPASSFAARVTCELHAVRPR